jgi:hypothetical protein
MLVAGYVFTLVTGATAFGLSRTDLPALRWTDPATVREAIGLADGTNVFAIDTAPLEASLSALPAVASADVAVVLPDAALVVRIAEREPILVWKVQDRRFLVDREGTIFASLDADATAPAGLPTLDDRRQASVTALAVGGHVDPVDLDVATRLGSLSPEDVGSIASGLRVAATDSDGFVITTAGGWTAVFGFYSPATRATDLVPGQVRLLRSLLAGHEGTVARVILASATDGTYVPRTTPKATPR